MNAALIAATELHALMEAQDVVVLDASLAPIGYSGEPMSLRCIPGAQFLDIEGEGSDANSGLPHTLPSVQDFSDYAQRLGVNKDVPLVIYDRYNLYSSARAWWMFMVMGHSNVSVLADGLAGWEAAGFATASAFAKLPRGNFVAKLQPQWLVGTEAVLAALDQPNVKIVDARSAGRFAGSQPEPREGLRGGHMPGAVNLPYTELYEKGRWLPTAALRSRLEAVGLSAEQRLIFSCGSGVTACLLMLAAWECGYRDLAVYDGSWAEWGGNSSLPVIK